jgi:hypothetical protein
VSGFSHSLDGRPSGPPRVKPQPLAMNTRLAKTPTSVVTVSKFRGVEVCGTVRSCIGDRGESVSSDLCLVVCACGTYRAVVIDGRWGCYRSRRHRLSSFRGRGRWRSDALSWRYCPSALVRWQWVNSGRRAPLRSSRWMVYALGLCSCGRGGLGRGR